MPGVPDQLFQSSLFARWPAPGLPVEFMAGLHLHGRPLTIQSRETRTLGAAILFVPPHAELIAMFPTFGRPKDIARADLLARM